MKTIITLLISLLIAISTFAQQGINYKAVIKDGSGNIVASQEIDVKFSIIEDTGSTVVYAEDHLNIMTDANGIIILNIGEGTPTTNTFVDVDWGSDTHSLKTEIDLDGTFVPLPETQFKAVPYALQAESATFSTINNVTSNTPGDIANDDFVFGSTQLDHNEPDEGPRDYRMFFDISNGSFRAGGTQSAFLINATNGMSWDESMRGVSSFATGFNTEASGFYSFASGEKTWAKGNWSTSFGFFTQGLGSGSFSSGINTKAKSYAETAIGLYNTDYSVQSGGATSPFLLDRLFVIGNGTSSSNKSDALIVLKNGTITAPSFDIAEITDNKALVTKEYFDTNVPVIPIIPDAPTGLEQITENGRTGWRLKGAIPSYHVTIGEHALDFSYSDEIPPNLALSGDFSTAFGKYTIAYGKASTSMGNDTFAVGENSTAMGLGTYVTKDNSVAIGKYNFDNANALFMVGNGTSSQQNNALEVNENGTIYAPSLTNSLINTAGDKALITKEYAEANFASDDNYLKAGGNIVTNNVGIGRLTPSSLFEVYHQDGPPTSGNRTNAFSVRNVLGPSWQMYASGGSSLYIYSNGNYRGSFNGTSGAYVQTSDRRLKKDIVSLDNGTLDKVMLLNPVSYLMKDQKDTNRNLGLISQEVQELFPSITHYVEEHDILTLSYTELIPILIKALQEQQTLFEQQNKKIGIQDSKIDTFESSMKTLTQRMEKLEANNQ